MNKLKEKKLRKQNEDWMLSPHKCDDCMVRVGIITAYSKENKNYSLYQCTRCKTVITRWENII